MAKTAEQWVRILDEDYIRWDYYVEDLIELHRELHEQYGAEPNDAIIPGEQRLSNTLREYGIEHRYTDELSKKAGTFIENPAPPTVDEVRAYLDKPITLLRPASSLVQGLDGGAIYLKFDGGILSPEMQGSVLKMLQRRLPPEISLELLSGPGDGEFATSSPFQALVLDTTYGSKQVTVWSTVVAKMQESASRASRVFKRDTTPSVPLSLVRLAKADAEPEQRFALSEVLVPGEIDTTTFNPDGSETGADGDVYDEVEVEKACHWFAEHSQQFCFMHTAMGGKTYYDQEVVMLENYIQRNDWQVSAERVIKAGTWMLGARVNDDQVWADIQSGKLNTWSIEARAMAYLEEAA